MTHRFRQTIVFARNPTSLRQIQKCWVSGVFSPGGDRVKNPPQPNIRAIWIDWRAEAARQLLSMQIFIGLVTVFLPCYAP